MGKVSTDKKGLVLLGEEGWSLGRCQDGERVGHWSNPFSHRPKPHPDLKSQDSRNEEPGVAWLQ